jgi:hypothetical protein
MESVAIFILVAFVEIDPYAFFFFLFFGRTLSGLYCFVLFIWIWSLALLLLGGYYWILLVTPYCCVEF